MIKSFRDLEGKYIDYLSIVAKKTIIPAGLLVQDPIKEYDHDDTHTGNIIRWLEKSDKSSVVFVSFGSEYFLCRTEREEIAHGLELSKVYFIWVVRFPLREKVIQIEKELPEGFLDMVGKRGLIVEGWTPQARILGHTSTGEL